MKKGYHRLGLSVFILTFLLMPAIAEAQKAKAVLSGTEPGIEITGEMFLERTEQGLRVHGTIENAPPGPHGFHIHEYGDCSDRGEAAGSHFNPHDAPHGYLPENGIGHAHAGDLGNIHIGEDGIGRIDVTVEGLELTGYPYGVVGRAFIMHEDPDDFSQPLGNAGPRIVCGPIFLIADEND